MQSWNSTISVELWEMKWHLTIYHHKFMLYLSIVVLKREQGKGVNIKRNFMNFLCLVSNMWGIPTFQRDKRYENFDRKYIMHALKIEISLLKIKSFISFTERIIWKVLKSYFVSFINISQNIWALLDNMKIKIELCS